MSKKQKILFFLIISPIILIYLYNYYFSSAGGWLEDYIFYFDLAFFIIFLIGSSWLILIYNQANGHRKDFILGLIVGSSMLVPEFILGKPIISLPDLWIKFLPQSLDFLNIFTYPLIFSIIYSLILRRGRKGFVTFLLGFLLAYISFLFYSLSYLSVHGIG